jgi:hypothetical protein
MDTQEKWNQLTGEHKQELLEKHRDVHTSDYGWWGGVFEMLDEGLKEIGVRAMEKYFSGFWNQGDGACFDGYVFNWALFLAAVGKPELIPAAVDAPNFSWKSLGRYCHENTVEFDTDSLWQDNPYDEEDEAVRHEIWKANNEEGGALYAVRDDLVEFLKDRMRQFYSDLEEEYEYLNSDEAVLDCILANCEDEIDDLLEEQRIDELEPA